MFRLVNGVNHNSLRFMCIVNMRFSQYTCTVLLASSGSSLTAPRHKLRDLEGLNAEP